MFEYVKIFYPSRLFSQPREVVGKKIFSSFWKYRIEWENNY
jgi:hypothetical protein